MTKLFIVKFFRQLSSKKTVSTLTEEDAWLLSFKEKNGEILIINQRRTGSINKSKKER